MSLNGFTNWFTTGEGDTKQTHYELVLELDRSLTGGDASSTIPEKTGIMWFMPMSSSTPSATKWEVGVFNFATGSLQKTQMAI